MRSRRTMVVTAAAFLLSGALGACALVAGIEEISVDSDSGTRDATLANDGQVGTDRDISVSPGDATTDKDEPFDAGPSCPPTGTFGSPVPVGELNTTSDEWSARFTPDERVVYFASAQVVPVQLYIASRASRSTAFGAPTPITGPTIAGRSIFHPSFLPNQDTLVVQFDNDAASPVVGVSTRNSPTDFFPPPTPIGIVNAGGGKNLNPFLTPDGTSLWFSSDRNGGVFNAYESTISSGAFGTPEVATLGAATDDAQTPVLSDDALTLYFSSVRGTGGSDFEIYRAMRGSRSAAWGTPVKVTELNSASAYDAPTWLSPDGCRLYLMSNRTSGQGLDIFVATRQP